MRRSILLALIALGPGTLAVAAPTFSTQRVISSQADLCFDVRTEDVDADGEPVGSAPTGWTPVAGHVRASPARSG
jgi:hypothetical protein